MISFFKEDYEWDNLFDAIAALVENGMTGFDK